MGAIQWTQQWRVVHHICDTYDRNPGVGFPNVADTALKKGPS